MTTMSNRRAGALVPTEPYGLDEPEPDRGLWQRAAMGDRAAFAELFERHVDAVWKYAYRLTGSTAVAEDLVSATFLAAWRRRTHVVLVRDSALPWLYAVAGNLAKAEHRRVTRFLRLLPRLGVEQPAVDHADQVVGRLDEDRRMREIADAIAELPSAEREAVRLCLLGELSTAEAAQALGIAESSVRARISRARSKLRALLQEGL